MSTYEERRSTYWEAQRTFRTAAVGEIIRSLPSGTVTAAVLEISDTPRLSLKHLLDVDGNPIDDGLESERDAIDQITSDMEAFTWEEVDSFLESLPDGDFIIRRN